MISMNIKENWKSSLLSTHFNVFQGIKLLQA
jgi:hypothetical protein